MKKISEKVIPAQLDPDFPTPEMEKDRVTGNDT